MPDTTPPERVAQLAQQSGFTGFSGTDKIITLEDTRLYGAPTVLYPYTDGCIAWPVKYQPLAFRWQDVLAFYQSVTHVYKNNSFKHVAYKFRLELAGGRTIAIEGHSDNAGKGWEHLQRFRGEIAPLIAKAQLSRMVAELQAGQQVPFGPLAVTGDGVRRGRKMQELLPWSEAGQADVYKGTLRVLRQRRPQLWASFPIEKVPNVEAFLALTRFIAEHAVTRAPSPRKDPSA